MANPHKIIIHHKKSLVNLNACSFTHILNPEADSVGISEETLFALQESPSVFLLIQFGPVSAARLDWDGRWFRALRFDTRAAGSEAQGTGHVGNPSWVIRRRKF
jgi:hypothetical protein